MLPVLAVLLCHVLCHLSVQVPCASANKNVLLIIADDMRPDINFYSNLSVRTGDVRTTFTTPNIDSLAEDSLVFTRAYAQVALCGPSRASFLTSRYPDNIKVINLDDDFRDAAPSIKTLPQYFREAGYNVQGMGKIFHDDHLENSYGLSWTNYTHVDDDWIRNETNSWRAVTASERAATPLVDDLIRDAALRTLDDVSGPALDGSQNFFMAVGFKKPHLRWIFPEEFLSYYPEDVELPPNSNVPINYPEIAWSRCASLCQNADIQATGIDCADYENSHMPDDVTRTLRRAYFSCVTYIDSLIGDVLEKLENLGLSNNTVIAFMSDHGWLLREHNAWCKQSNFEASLRIPLMIRVPGSTDGGVVTEKLVEAIDVMPTLIDAAGLSPLASCPARNSAGTDACTDGDNLLPLIRNPDLSSWTKPAYSQISRNGARISNAATNTMGYSVRDEKYRYTLYAKFNTNRWKPAWKNIRKYEDEGLTELYDLRNDEWENNNLVSSSGAESNQINRKEKKYFKLLKAKFQRR